MRRKEGRHFLDSVKHPMGYARDDTH